MEYSYCKSIEQCGKVQLPDDKPFWDVFVH